MSRRLARYLPDVLDDYDPGVTLSARLLAGRPVQPDLPAVPAGRPGRPETLGAARPPLGHVMPSAHDMAASSAPCPAWPGPASRRRGRAHCARTIRSSASRSSSTTTSPGLIVADEAAARQLTAAQAGQLCGDLVSTLARLHAVTPPPAPPGRSASAKDYLGRQVARWTGQWRHTATRELAAFEPLARWLREEISGLPTDYDVTLVHGDYRLDNLVLDPGTQQVRAVLDWEMSTLGDPLMDLALLLVYWEQPGDRLRHQVNVARNLTTGDGFWSRDQLLSAYAQATAGPLDHLHACLGLACLKLAVVMESIHYRHLAGQALDPLSAGLGTPPPPCSNWAWP